jgi:hypothetical protein
VRGGRSLKVAKIFWLSRWEGMHPLWWIRAWQLVLSGRPLWKIADVNSCGRTMAGVSAYAALGSKTTGSTGTGGSTRRLRRFDILRTDGKLDIYIYIYN